MKGGAGCCLGAGVEQVTVEPQEQELNHRRVCGAHRRLRQTQMEQGGEEGVPTKAP